MPACHILVKSKPHFQFGDMKLWILLEAKEKGRDRTEEGSSAEEPKQRTCWRGASSLLVVEALWSFCLAKGSSFSISGEGISEEKKGASGGHNSEV